MSESAWLTKVHHAQNEIRIEADKIKRLSRIMRNAGNEFIANQLEECAKYILLADTELSAGINQMLIEDIETSRNQIAYVFKAILSKGEQK